MQAFIVRRRRARLAISAWFEAGGTPLTSLVAHKAAERLAIHVMSEMPVVTVSGVAVEMPPAYEDVTSSPVVVAPVVSVNDIPMGPAVCIDLPGTFNALTPRRTTSARRAPSDESSPESVRTQSARVREESTRLRDQMKLVSINGVAVGSRDQAQRLLDAAVGDVALQVIRTPPRGTPLAGLPSARYRVPRTITLSKPYPEFTFTGGANLEITAEPTGPDDLAAAVVQSVLKDGDVLAAVNGQACTRAEYAQILLDSAVGTVVLSIVRGDEFITVNLDKGLFPQGEEGAAPPPPWQPLLQRVPVTLVEKEGSRRRIVTLPRSQRPIAPVAAQPAGTTRRDQTGVDSDDCEWCLFAAWCVMDEDFAECCCALVFFPCYCLASVAEGSGGDGDGCDCD